MIFRASEKSGQWGKACSINLWPTPMTTLESTWVYTHVHMHMQNTHTHTHAFVKRIVLTEWSRCFILIASTYKTPKYSSSSEQKNVNTDKQRTSHRKRDLHTIAWMALPYCTVVSQRMWRDCIAPFPACGVLADVKYLWWKTHSRMLGPGSGVGVSLQGIPV